MFLFLAACTGGPGDVVPLAGTITADSGQVAEVRAGTAFAVTTAGKAAILVSPNPDSTCADAAGFLASGDEDYNPGVVSGEGVCNLYIRLDDYDGTELTLTDDVLATLALNCAMDTGEWRFEERKDGYEGFFYSGPFWVGSPDAYTLTVSGGDGEDLSLDLSMDSYYGRFPYDADEPESDLAAGAVAGSATATWCPDMGPALN
ncbi:MAG: hypothetical protein Q8P41_25400 [Pseudomonadota bacterium]|nr:hypothetical protein [Pseudomonadota bacterium]